MAAGIMIVPWWQTQFWFLMMVPLLQGFSVVIPTNVQALPSNKGLQHPFENETASSLVTIRGYLKLSEHPLVSRYMKGIYNRHPPLPKYVNIWDILLLLRDYDNMDSNDNLQFKALVKKTVMLFIIFGARRKQALFAYVLATAFIKKIKSFCFPIKP